MAETALQPIFDNVDLAAGEADLPFNQTAQHNIFNVMAISSLTAKAMRAANKSSFNAAARLYQPPSSQAVSGHKGGSSNQYWQCHVLDKRRASHP